MYLKVKKLYVDKAGLRMDIKYFFGTIVNVLKRSDVVEGGTGKIDKEKAGKELVKR